jgi:hypothetical protein
VWVAVEVGGEVVGEAVDERLGGELGAGMVEVGLAFLVSLIDDKEEKTYLLSRGILWIEFPRRVWDRRSS